MEEKLQKNKGWKWKVSELGGNEKRSIWKDYFEDLYDIDTQEQVAVHVCGFDGVQRGNYFGGEPIMRNKEEERVRKLKNRNASCKDEVTGVV